MLKRPGQQWVLSDEPHTYRNVIYDLDEKDLQQ